MKLYHYTCADHGAQGILADGGLVKPNPKAGQQLFIDAYVLPVIWLTDIAVTERDDGTGRDSLGLGSVDGLSFTRCDRLAYRFIVQAVSAQHWPGWADAHDLDGVWRTALESVGSPDHWWVSEVPIPGARLDTRYVPPALVSASRGKR